MVGWGPQPHAGYPFPLFESLSGSLYDRLIPHCWFSSTQSFHRGRAIHSNHVSQGQRSQTRLRRRIYSILSWLSSGYSVINLSVPRAVTVTKKTKRGQTAPECSLWFLKAAMWLFFTIQSFFQHHKEKILDNNDGKHTYIKIAMEQKLIGEELHVLNQIYGNYYLR